MGERLLILPNASYSVKLLTMYLPFVLGRNSLTIIFYYFILFSAPMYVVAPGNSACVLGKKVHVRTYKYIYIANLNLHDKCGARFARQLYNI